MRFSALTTRIINDDKDSPRKIDPWAVHNLAMQRVEQGDPVTVLSIGQETNETTPDIIVEAAVTSLRSGRHHYADVRGDERLRAAVANYHDRLTGQSMGADDVTIFVGAQNALFAVAQVLLGSEDEVILVAPFYTTYEATFGASGPTVITVQVESVDGYNLDEDRLIAAVTPKTQAIVLNAPNNPLGSRYTKSQLEKIVKTCVDNNIWLILDAVYIDIVDADSIDLPHHVPGAENILITVGSLSKSHRMTGWRVGWAIGPAPLSEHLGNLSVCMHYGLAPFVMDAAIVALEQSTETPGVVRAMMQARRSVAIAAFTDLEPVRLLDAGQGMFVLLDVEPLGMDAFTFAMELLASHNVSILPCDGFGPGGRFLLRIGLCIDGSALSSACNRIQQFIHEKRAKD
jgi:arginine:pyruvate transaminase